MKKIEAIIRTEKFSEVKEALQQTGVLFFTYWDVTGVGNETHGHVYRGVAYNTADIPRRMLSIVVQEELLENTVEVLLRTAYTGKIGDGKLFISTIDEAYRIRTKESGIKSLM